VGETTDTSLQLTTPRAAGAHRWQVVARDARGQSKNARTRLVRVDARAPSLAVSYRRRGRVVRLSVRGRDSGVLGRSATGLRSIVVSWGDRTKGATGTSSVRASHRYPRRGSYPLQITATDRAGNARTSLRTVRIG
jgi:hypothetical protein